MCEAAGGGGGAGREICFLCFYPNRIWMALVMKRYLPYDIIKNNIGGGGSYERVNSNF